jgi:hypothetical protein
MEVFAWFDHAELRSPAVGTGIARLPVVVLPVVFDGKRRERVFERLKREFLVIFEVEQWREVGLLAKVVVVSALLKTVDGGRITPQWFEEMRPRSRLWQSRSSTSLRRHYV